MEIVWNNNLLFLEKLWELVSIIEYIGNLAETNDYVINREKLVNIDEFKFHY